MSDGEERSEALSEEFEVESIENRPSLSWSDLAQEQEQEPSDSEGSTSTPSLSGAASLQDVPQRRSTVLQSTLTASNRRILPASVPPVGAGTSATAIMATTIDTGDGVMVEIAVTPRSTQGVTLGGVMFRKEDRAPLSMEKRTELFDKITLKKLDTTFTEMSISLSDIEKLDDTYNVAMLVDRVRDHFIKYDLHGIFQIVDPVDPATSSAVNAPLGNLFTSYSTISETAVARSNEWYRRWAVSTEYETNLQLSLDFLATNTSEALWEKTLEAHALYPVEQQGGPLAFILMMKKIQYDTEDAVRYLQEGVKKMKLTNFAGENVERAVSLLRGAERRLRNTESGVPQDFTKWVLDIFQTSSVDVFNAQFALYNGMFSLGRKVATAPMIQPTPGELYKLAEQTYLELVSTDAWTGITTKGTTHTGLTVGGAPSPAPHTPVCWNCGEPGHNVMTCPKPKNQKRIDAERTKFRKDRKKSGSPRKVSHSKPTKWAPPTKDEKGKRVIDGKPYYYHYKSKRWNPETGAPAAAQVVQPPAASAPAPAVVPVSAPAPVVAASAPAIVAQGNTARQVAFSNTAFAISEALRNLSATLE